MTKIEANLKRAIWKAYQKKCYYCDEYVSWRELHIDHFIPSHTDSSLKREIISELNLENDFDFNSLKNLVPAHSSCNTARKGKFVPKAHNFAGTLLITESHIPKILDIKKKLDKREKYDEDISQLATYIEKGHATPEEIYDYVRENDESFTEIEDFGKEYVRVSTRNVMIHCQLPIFPEIQGSMMIAFRSLRIRDCYITFSHKEIVRVLFQGIGSRPDSRLRNFIVACDVSKNKCVVQLGNNRFTISVDEVTQLCNLIDKVAPSYIDAVKKIEMIYKTTIFLYSPKKRFKLLKISRHLWREILDFAREHDYENGESEWHIFDGKASYLKIYCKMPQGHTKKYRSFIYPESVEERDWDSFVYPDDEVWLCWDSSILVDTEEDVERLKNNIIWDAMYSYNWLKHILIPVVMDYTRSNNRSFLFKLFKLFKGRKYLATPFENFDYYSSMGNSIMEITNIKNVTNVKEWVDNVQRFFSVYSSHFLSVSSIEGVYNAILDCFKFFKLNHGTLNYLNIKLDGQDSLETIKQSVEKKINDLKNSSGVNGSNMEYALRSLCAILREGILIVDEDTILENIIPYLTILNKEYKFLHELERARVF